MEHKHKGYKRHSKSSCIINTKLSTNACAEQWTMFSIYWILNIRYAIVTNSWQMVTQMWIQSLDGIMCMQPAFMKFQRQYRSPKCKFSSLPSTPFFSLVSDLFCASGKTGTRCVGFTITGWNTLFGCSTVAGAAGLLLVCWWCCSIFVLSASCLTTSTGWAAACDVDTWRPILLACCSTDA